MKQVKSWTILAYLMILLVYLCKKSLLACLIESMKNCENADSPKSCARLISKTFVSGAITPVEINNKGSWLNEIIRIPESKYALRLYQDDGIGKLIICMLTEKGSKSSLLRWIYFLPFDCIHKIQYSHLGSSHHCLTSY